MIAQLAGEDVTQAAWEYRGASARWILDALNDHREEGDDRLRALCEAIIALANDPDNDEAKTAYDAA